MPNGAPIYRSKSTENRQAKKKQPLCLLSEMVLSLNDSVTMRLVNQAQEKTESLHGRIM
jgi:hypothetical protein